MPSIRTWLGLAGLAVMLSACTQTSTPVAEVVQQPTTVLSPTPQATPTESVDYCLQCHTDKDQLILNARPEEEIVEESEGTG